MNAFESARGTTPQVAEWVVGGHSLGGTVAAMEAEAAAAAPVGLMLYASYPASDMSTSLTSRVVSISGTNDGLATPADIEASKANLPKDTVFTPIDGGVHAFFGDYGPQPGDGTPTISHDQARQQISQASLAFLAAVRAPDAG
jgi:pimeloyl-ACP methyl ester carboxylesterase